MNLAFRSRIRFTAARRMLPGALLGILLAAGSATHAAGPLELVSRNSSGGAGSLGVGGQQPAVTPDGRYVAFFTDDATNLVSPVAPGWQIYLRDRTLGTTELVSVSSGGSAANGYVEYPSISDDGCRIVFTSTASNLVPDDTNSQEDVFLRDRCAVPATTTRISLSSSNSQLTLGGKEGRISANGQIAVFASNSADAVPGLTCNICENLLVRDLQTATTSVLGTYYDANAGVTRAQGGFWPAPSADGSRVAYCSHANPMNFSPWPMSQIYVQDRGTNTLLLASADAAGNPQSNGNQSISLIVPPAISGDGNVVAFRSTAASLVSGVADGNYHAFVKILATGEIVVGDIANTGELGNGSVQGRPSLSHFGHWVAFTSSSTNLAPEGAGTSYAPYAHSIYTGRTIGFTNLSTSAEPALSDDPHGRYVSFYSGSALDPNYANRGYFMTDRYKWLNFSDVPASHWALTYINALLDWGVTTGCGAGRYCPANNVDRQQMAAFIIRAIEGEPAACATQPFNDVPVSHSFCKYIKRMKDLAITTGCGNNNYCPTGSVDRQQMAAFIIRAVEGEPAACATQPFNDIPASHGMCKYIKRMKDLNITTGCGNNNYCPTQIVTRDQMAAFLARAFLGM